MGFAQISNSPFPVFWYFLFFPSNEAKQRPNLGNYIHFHRSRRQARKTIISVFFFFFFFGRLQNASLFLFLIKNHPTIHFDRENAKKKKIYIHINKITDGPDDNSNRRPIKTMNLTRQQNPIDDNNRLLPEWQ